MDITPYLGTIVTVVIAVGSVYAAIASRLTKLETLIVDLRRDVEKHNQVIERTYKLETRVDALTDRVDELHGDFREIKIGGSE